MSIGDLRQLDRLRSNHELLHFVGFLDGLRPVAFTSELSTSLMLPSS